MAQFLLTLTDEQMAFLREYKRTSCIPISKLILLALHEYFDVYEICDNFLFLGGD